MEDRTRSAGTVSAISPCLATRQVKASRRSVQCHKWCRTNQ